MSDIPVLPDGKDRKATVPDTKGNLEIQLRADGDAAYFSDSRGVNTRLDIWHDRVQFMDFKAGTRYDVSNAQVAKAIKDVVRKAFDDTVLTDAEQSQIESFKAMIIGDIADGKFDNVKSIVEAAKNFVPSKKTPG